MPPYLHCTVIYSPRGVYLAVQYSLSASEVEIFLNIVVPKSETNNPREERTGAEQGAK
jgi:hypothetical protein